MAEKHPVDGPDNPYYSLGSLLTGLTCLLVFVNTIFYVSTKTIEGKPDEYTPVLTEPKSHKLICIDGNNVVTIEASLIIIVDDNQFTTELKRYMKDKCKVVKKDE